MMACGVIPAAIAMPLAPDFNSLQQVPHTISIEIHWQNP
jgi:hypothetical protein